MGRFDYAISNANQTSWTVNTHGFERTINALETRYWLKLPTVARPGPNYRFHRSKPVPAGKVFISTTKIGE